MTNTPHIDEACLARYLLGELPENDQDRLDDRLLAEEEVFEQLLCAEEGLIDAYIEGEMPPATRRRFEEHYLTTPWRRIRVDTARALPEHPAVLNSQASGKATEPDAFKAFLRQFLPSPAVRWACAGGVGLVLAAALLFPWPDFGSTITVELLPNVRETVKAPEAALSTRVKQVRLVLEVERADAYRSFSARLSSRHGEENLGPADVDLQHAPSSSLVIARLRAERLPTGSVELVLEGEHRERGPGVIASYFFQVTR